MKLFWWLGPPLPDEVQNPEPFTGWPEPNFVTPDMEGPMPGSLLGCGCHIRRPDYETVLCDEHLAELNHA